MKQLIDPFQRKIEYLRLSVTDRCDLRCNYCIPKGYKGFAEPPNWLSFDEMERLVGTLTRMGVKKVRITGGEPLLRRNLPELAYRLKQLDGLEDLSLSTNATQLEGLAQPLKDAGVDRLNVSLDSLVPQRYAELVGRDCLDQVLAGLRAAQQAGFGLIKINMVAMKGRNDDEIDTMVSFCQEQGFILRLIELMPMGDTGRSVEYLDLQPIRQRLIQRFGLVEGVVPGSGPARYLQTPGGDFSVGFITPLSQHFCASCNRVRLSVDGVLYLCLGQEDSYDFRSLLRQNVTDEALSDAVREAVGRKPERHEFNEKPEQIVRFMSATGG